MWLREKKQRPSPTSQNLSDYTANLQTMSSQQSHSISTQASNKNAHPRILDLPAPWWTAEVVRVEKAAKAVANVQWQAYIQVGIEHTASIKDDLAHKNMGQTKRFRTPTSAFSKKKQTPPSGDSETGGWAMVHQDLEDNLDNIIDQDGVSSPSGLDFEPEEQEGQEEDDKDDKSKENGSDRHPLVEASKMRTKLVKATHEAIMQACQSIDSETYSSTPSREKCKAPAGGTMPGLTTKKHNSGMGATQAPINHTPKTPLANGLKPEFHSSKANRQSKLLLRRQDEALEQQPTAKVILGALQKCLSQSSIIMNAVTSSKSQQAPSNLDLPARSQHIFVTRFVPILQKYIGMRENHWITDALIEPIQVLLDTLMIDWPHKFSDENDLIYCLCMQKIYDWCKALGKATLEAMDALWALDKKYFDPEDCKAYVEYALGPRLPFLYGKIDHYENDIVLMSKAFLTPLILQMFAAHLSLLAPIEGNSKLYTAFTNSNPCSTLILAVTTDVAMKKPELSFSDTHWGTKTLYYIESIKRIKKRKYVEILAEVQQYHGYQDDHAQIVVSSDIEPSEDKE
ncbi:hypothetical protein BKA82DRAFT_4009173 [Pisolithus tinctorius]|nr:hypothetical protein BKA82DRAFT_4009173 [Pisolithus tinctorius]